MWGQKNITIQRGGEKGAAPNQKKNGDTNHFNGWGNKYQHLLVYTPGVGIIPGLGGLQPKLATQTQRKGERRKKIVFLKKKKPRKRKKVVV